MRGTKDELETAGPGRALSSNSHELNVVVLTMTPITRSLEIYASACQPRFIPYDTKAIVVL